MDKSLDENSGCKTSLQLRKFFHRIAVVLGKLIKALDKNYMLMFLLVLAKGVVFTSSDFLYLKSFLNLQSK